MLQMKGKQLIDYVLELDGVTLWMNNRNINDLAEFDLFKWYDIEQKGNKVHITEVQF